MTLTLDLNTQIFKRDIHEYSSTNRNQPVQEGQPSSFNRGIVYLIGGVLCINIYTFVHAIWNTLGIN